MNEKKQKIVKNMLNVSMAVFVLYIVLGLVICLQPKIFLKSMLGYGEIILENSVLNFWRIYCNRNCIYLIVVSFKEEDI